ncbi:MAG TPA: DUF488 domain-containing protein [Terriglobales bacterium]|nr:DUF488 domain-containing protein [Terriglobales bacterium]
MSAPPTLFTIGHSTLAAEAFLARLRRHGVEQVADVRTLPKSRHNPQFGQAELAAALAAAGLGYLHLPRLGGLRRPRADSVNLGWRNLSFRGFADYMATPEFAAGLAELEAWAGHRPTALMCAEAVPWRCHRSLIADALGLRGWRVLDILGDRPARPHRPIPFLRVVEGRPVYPAPDFPLPIQS